MDSEKVDQVLWVDLIGVLPINLAEDLVIVEIAGVGEAGSEVFELGGGRGTSSWEYARPFRMFIASSYIVRVVLFK